MALQIIRLVAVIALLCAAAALATPPGRLPLALRGLAKIMGRNQPSQTGRVSTLRKVAALILVLAAVLLSLAV
jgi:hypothetical protein